MIEESWVAALRECYLLARGERLNELRGRYVKRFDERGLHPFSVAWMAWQYRLPEGLTEAMSEAPELLDVSTKRLRDAAAEEAESIFVAQVIEEHERKE